MSTADEAGAPPPERCSHTERTDGICVTCGHCLHELILNGACYYCGSTELDGVMVSPKKTEQLVPADRLVRHKPG